MVRNVLTLSAMTLLAMVSVPGSAPSATALYEVKPVAAGSVVVRRNPPRAGNRAVAEAAINRDGRFSIRARLEPGFDYEISLPCETQAPCPQRRLGSLAINGRTVSPVAAPQTRDSERNGIGIYLIGALVLNLRQADDVRIDGQVVEDVIGPIGPVGNPDLNPQALSPYAGLDIMFGGGRMVTAGRTSLDGRFSGRIEVSPGEHEITAVCPARTACPPFRLVSVRIDGRDVKPDPRGRFVFTVRPGTPAVLVEANSALQEVSTTR